MLALLKSVGVLPFSSLWPGFHVKYLFPKQKGGFTIQENFGTLVGRLLSKYTLTNCRGSMWESRRN